MQIMKITLFFPNGNSFIPSLTFNIITYILFIMLQHSPFFSYVFLCFVYSSLQKYYRCCMLNIINNFSLLINLRYSFRNYFSFRRTFFFVMLLCCLCCCLYEMGKTFNVSRLLFFSYSGWLKFCSLWLLLKEFLVVPIPY